MIKEETEKWLDKALADDESNAYGISALCHELAALREAIDLEPIREELNVICRCIPREAP